MFITPTGYATDATIADDPNRRRLARSPLVERASSEGALSEGASTRSASAGSASTGRASAEGASESSSRRQLLVSGAPPWYAFPPTYLRRGPGDGGYSPSTPAPAPAPLPAPNAHAIGHIGSLPEDDEWAPGSYTHHNVDDDEEVGGFVRDL